MTNVTRLPEPGVILDLDAAERPEKDIKPPFIVTLGGKNVTFADPNELDWRDLAQINGPEDLIRVSLSSEDRVHLASTDLPGWKFNKLIGDYYTHYDLESKIREAKRREQFGL